MVRPGLARGAVLTFAWLILFIVCTYLFFPSRRINTFINQALSAQGLTLTPAVRKTVLPGLAWDKALLSSGQGPLVQLDRLTVKPVLMRLLTGRLALDCTAVLGGGRLSCEYGLAGRQSISLDADRLELSRLPLFKTVLGAQANGSLRSEGRFTRGAKGWNGELKLEIRQLAFSGVRMGAFMLPDADGLTSQGMVRVADGAARLESLTLQGEGVYMRLSGDIPPGAAAPLNLTLEIMPKPEFLEKQKLAFLLLARFMTSPGVYRVPIKGTLLKPEIV